MPDRERNLSVVPPYRPDYDKHSIRQHVRSWATCLTILLVPFLVSVWAILRVLRAIWQ